jgi:COMPASS component SWD2
VPFDTFLVGRDTAEVSDIKFSNDGKSMLLTTTNNHIYVLDAYGGDKLSYIIFPFSVLQIPYICSGCI